VRAFDTIWRRKKKGGGEGGRGMRSRWTFLLVLFIHVAETGREGGKKEGERICAALTFLENLFGLRPEKKKRRKGKGGRKSDDGVS